MIIHLNLKNRVYETLNECLNSLISLKGELSVISDGHLNDDVLNTHDCMVKYTNEKNFTEERNYFIDPKEWNLYIKPNEILTSPQKILGAMKTKSTVFNLLVYNAGIINKEIRLWKEDLKFENPTYQHIDRHNAENLDCILQSKFLKGSKHKDSTEEILKEWLESNPTSARPYYYMAFRQLENKNYDSFLRYANEYLSRDNLNCMSTLMMKYYYASVMCYYKKDIHESTRHILGCLTIKPLMSEFWCLLGDIFYMIGEDYNKAKTIYENAKILGSKRDADDEWPLSVAMYRNYPDNMIANCNNLIEKSKLYYLNR